MKCIRCGSEMKDDDRCCLRCGAINYNNPLNSDYIKKYADKKEYNDATSFIFKKRAIKRRRLKILLIVIFILIIFGIIYLFNK